MAFGIRVLPNGMNVTFGPPQATGRPAEPLAEALRRLRIAGSPEDTNAMDRLRTLIGACRDQFPCSGMFFKSVPPLNRPDLASRIASPVRAEFEKFLKGEINEPSAELLAEIRRYRLENQMKVSNPEVQVEYKAFLEGNVEKPSPELVRELCNQFRRESLVGIVSAPLHDEWEQFLGQYDAFHAGRGERPSDQLTDELSHLFGRTPLTGIIHPALDRELRQFLDGKVTRPSDDLAVELSRLHSYIRSAGIVAKLPDDEVPLTEDDIASRRRITEALVRRFEADSPRVDNLPDEARPKKAHLTDYLKRQAEHGERVTVNLVDVDGDLRMSEFPYFGNYAVDILMHEVLPYPKRAAGLGILSTLFALPKILWDIITQAKKEGRVGAGQQDKLKMERIIRYFVAKLNARRTRQTFARFFEAHGREGLSDFVLRELSRQVAAGEVPLFVSSGPNDVVRMLAKSLKLDPEGAFGTFVETTRYQKFRKTPENASAVRRRFDRVVNSLLRLKFWGLRDGDEVTTGNYDWLFRRGKVRRLAQGPFRALLERGYEVRVKDGLTDSADDEPMLRLASHAAIVSHPKTEDWSNQVLDPQSRLGVVGVVVEEEYPDGRLERGKRTIRFRPVDPDDASVSQQVVEQVLPAEIPRFIGRRKTHFKEAWLMGAGYFTAPLAQRVAGNLWHHFLGSGPLESPSLLGALGMGIGGAAVSMVTYFSMLTDGSSSLLRRAVLRGTLPLLGGLLVSGLLEPRGGGVFSAGSLAAALVAPTAVETGVAAKDWIREKLREKKPTNGKSFFKLLPWRVIRKTTELALYSGIKRVIPWLLRLIPGLGS